MTASCLIVGPNRWFNWLRRPRKSTERFTPCNWASGHRSPQAGGTRHSRETPANAGCFVEPDPRFAHRSAPRGRGMVTAHFGQLSVSVSQQTVRSERGFRMGLSVRTLASPATGDIYHHVEHANLPSLHYARRRRSTAFLQRTARYQLFQLVLSGRDSSALGCSFAQSDTSRTVLATLSRWRHGFESRWGCNVSAGSRALLRPVDGRG